MPAPLFEFFETIADELLASNSRIITREDLSIKEREVPLLANLKKEMAAANEEDAIHRAINKLRSHFEAKGGALPFDYDPNTGRFSALDIEFLTFVREMSSIRSIGTRAREFECNVATWLGKRVTGTVHRVGHPRDFKKTRNAFNQHLKSLGFSRPVLLGRDKDGGFDILWMLPLGTVPHRPFVSVQCKNGEFSMEAADVSVGAGSRSFSQHGGFQPTIHVPCVLFNDYLHPQLITTKQMNYVPLGLTDLAALTQTVSVELI